MGYRYIALRDGTFSDRECTLSCDDALRQAGLEYRCCVGTVRVFASRYTPTLRLANGAVVIGHLFTRNGASVTDTSTIPVLSDDARGRRHLLENYWGDYLFLQPDTRNEHGLTVMRDPSGGVACIYSLKAEASFFTSDISLATVAGLYRKRVDWDYITNCLVYPNQKTQRTGLVDVKELLPGCTLRIADAKPRIEQDWSPWDFVDRSHRYTDPYEAAVDVRNAISSCVGAWAELDKSVLLEMSGGLDSSIVAACLRDTDARVVCCTLVTPVPGADERQYANLVAKSLDVALQTEMLDFDHACFNFVPPLSTVSPRMGTLQYAVNSVMSAAAERHDVVSSFSGAGGDTVFCYLTNAAPAADAFLERGLVAGYSATRNLSALHQCTLWKAGRLTLRKLMNGPKAPRQPKATFVDPPKVVDAPEDHPWFHPQGDAFPGDRERIAALADTQLYSEMSPRATKRGFRMPLLAQPVIEVCLRTPSWMWIAGGRNRAVARAAFADVLPPEILNRRSKGNFVNYMGGVYRRNKSFILDFLLSGILGQHQLLNTNVLSNFMSRDDLPTRDVLSQEIFDLCMIENWLRRQS